MSPAELATRIVHAAARVARIDLDDLRRRSEHTERLRRDAVRARIEGERLLGYRRVRIGR